MTIAQPIPSPGTRAFWQQEPRERRAAFAAMRANTPVIYSEEGRGGRGFWSVTRYADVRAVSRDTATFSSAQGFSLEDMKEEQARFVGSMIAMDDPGHARLRRLVQGGFTLRAIRDLEPALRELANSLLDNVAGSGEFDFASTIAAEYPMQVICELLGVPHADRPAVRDLVDEVIGASDPEFHGSRGPVASLKELYDYAQNLGAERKRKPGADITSKLMQASVEGGSLTAQEFGSFMILLIAAGIDTTRATLNWALHLLTEWPDQRELLLADYPLRSANAIEEIVRWASPVVHMRRTATLDVEVAGQQIAAGEKVVLWYLAANHDETVFADPERFDILRDVSDHVGFGAGGPHFCLGANLARSELTLLLGELLSRYPKVRATAEPTTLLSPFVNGIKSLPCVLT